MRTVSVRHLAIGFVAVVLLASACSAPGNDPAGSASPTTSAPADDTPVVPGDEWSVADPRDHGIDPAALEEMRDYAFVDERNTQAVVVVHGGEIVAEWYADGADADSWAASWSVAKSFTSAAVGIAIDEGHIDSVEDDMADYLDGWAGGDHDAVTVRDVLQMSSGVEFVETYDELPSDIADMVLNQPDQLAFAESRPQAHEPGTVFNYSSGDTMLLSGLVQSATGRPLADYAEEVLLDPIGIDRLDWWQDAEGHTLGYCCIDTTSRDFARFGLLYLRGGRWGDEQVVPEAWVEASIEPGAVTDGEYGYQWWTYDIDGLPDDMYMAIGVDEQYIYVIPSLDLVVVRNGTYVKDPGPPVADPNLYPRYPNDGGIPGRGTLAPDEWDSTEFLGPLVDSLSD